MAVNQRLYRTVAGIFLLTWAANSQSFPSGRNWSFGMKVSAPFTEALHGQTINAPDSEFFGGFSATGLPKTPNFKIGPSFEWRVSPRFSLQVDGLYQQVRYDFSSRGVFVLDPAVGPQSLVTQTRAKANRWEFPTMVKYHFRGETFRPFVSIGASFAWIDSIEQNSSSFSNNLFNQSRLDIEPAQKLVPGGVVGAGFEVSAGPLKLAPEFRYTRWGYRNLDRNYVQSNKNQAELMIGIRF